MKRTENITGAGIDLVTAPDKLSEGRLVDLVNFEPDSLGALHSRGGLEEIARDLSSVKYIKRFGENRYLIDSNSVRFGSDAGTVIFSGLDDGPTKIASYAGFGWLMNRQAQLRLEGARASNMGVPAPGVAPRAIVGPQAGALLDEFDLGGTQWDVYLVSGNIKKTPERRAIYYDTGTISITDGSTTITGTGTQWDGSFKNLFMRIYGPDGQTVLADVIITGVVSATEITSLTPLKNTLAGLNYEIFDWVDIQEYDTSNKLSGTSSFRVDLNPPGTWSVEARFDNPRDLTIGGKALDTDFMRFRFYADKPNAIDQVNITLIDDQNRYVLATINGELLNQSLFSWNHLRIPRAMDEKAVLGANPEFWRLSEARTRAIEAGDSATAENLARQMTSLYSRAMGSTPSFSARMGIEELGQTITFDWSKVVAARFSVVAKEACTVHFDRTEFVGGEQAPLEGVYRYWVTFENALGHESAPSPASEPVTVSNEPVTLENVIVSTDPQVVRRRIYRSGGVLTRPVRVGTIWNNSDTTFEDRMPDSQAQIDNIEPPWEADPPPRGNGIAGPFFGRLLAWGVEKHPARLYWSETGKPWSWPGSNDDFEGNWVDVGGDDDPIVDVVIQSNTARIYKERSIYRLAGDPDSADPEPVVTGLGAVGPYAVAPALGWDYFVSHNGVYRFSGDGAALASRRIDPLFAGRWVTFHKALPSIAPIKPGKLKDAYVAYFGGTLMVGVVDDANIGYALVYREDKNEWYRLRVASGAPVTALSYESYGVAPTWLIAAGSTLYALRRHLSKDVGLPIPVVLQTQLASGDDPATQAVWSEVEVDYQGGAATLKAIFADGSLRDLGTLSSASRTLDQFRIPADLGIRSNLVGVRIEGDLTAPLSIFGLWLYYLIEARFQKQFDSGAIDLTRRCRGEAINVAYQAGAAVDIKIYSDLPAGKMSLAQSLSLQPASERTSIELPLALEAQTLRVVAISPAPFQIHLMKVRVRPYALYLTGGGEWLSQQF